MSRWRYLKESYKSCSIPSYSHIYRVIDRLSPVRGRFPGPLDKCTNAAVVISKLRFVFDQTVIEFDNVGVLSITRSVAIRMK
jgi:hypothetical protein